MRALGGPAPASWQAAQAAGAGAATPTDLAAWWARFDDAALSRWAQRAQQGSPRALAAEAAWRQAVAQSQAAAAGLAPTLGFSASATRNTRGLQGDGTEERLQTALEARWVPDVFGAAGSALAAAQAQQQASLARWGDVQVQLAGEAALAYIDLRAQQLRLVLAQDTLASQQQTLQITGWRQQAGLVSSLELAQARAAVAQNQALLPALQAAIAQSRHTLALLAGLPPAAGSDAEDERGPPTLPTLPTAAEDLVLHIPAQALRQRADVRAAEHEVAAALARVGEAQAQRWPSFALAGSIGLSALTLGALGDGASALSTLLASVSLPLFDGGARRAGVQVQQAALQQAQAQYRSTVLGALKEVEDVLVALQGERVRLVALRSAAAAAAQAAALAGQRYRSGLADFQTVLETQRTTFSAQEAVLNTRADEARRHVQLYRALGGGWREAPALTAQAGVR
ncbi:hypothetical protein D621_18945 [beta proteobacterium AAP51]|nr:hypothetical protein D621_18945 [beta proteobacterium AAP51]